MSELHSDAELRGSGNISLAKSLKDIISKSILTREELQAIWYVMLSIQVIFITYFVQLPDLLKLNEEMFFWIFASKETIEELIERSVQT